MTIGSLPLQQLLFSRVEDVNTLVFPVYIF
jgi:hypothetical protein